MPMHSVPTHLSMLLQSKGQETTSQVHTRSALQPHREQHGGHASNVTGNVGLVGTAMTGAVTGGATGAAGILAVEGWTFGVFTGVGRAPPLVGAFTAVPLPSAVRSHG
jgi:hypothetical protein